MHLPHPFYKFPFRFDVERLRSEVEAISEESWCRHVQNFTGNSALPLVSTHGAVNEEFEPPMRATEYLTRSPYMMQVLAQFQTLLGRARLMRLEPRFGVPPHFDLQYYWRSHTRVHIPIITHPEIRFFCGPANVHMAAGEAWTFDNWRMHKVVNETETRRVHLTFDTYGSSAFWAMARPLGSEEPPRFISFEPNAKPELAFETYPGAPVMSPSELDLELSRLTADVAANRENDQRAVARFHGLCAYVRDEWRMLWHMHGPGEQGRPLFLSLALKFQEHAVALGENLQMASNKQPVLPALLSTISVMVKLPPAQAGALQQRPAKAAAPRAPRFEQPVFIVSAPRSGSTLLFEMLAANEAFWTLGGEGHGHVESIEALNPRSRALESNRLTAEDATPEVRAQLLANYVLDLCSAEGKLYREMDRAGQAIRFLEKTPKNALRIPFFKAIFHDAKFIFLQREARANISAIIEAWRSGRFVTYRDLTGWMGLPWSMLLIPGWRELNGAELADIATRQWRDTNETIMQDLAALPKDDWCSVRYEDVLADPAATLARLCAFAGVPFGEGLRALAKGPLKLSRYTLTPPGPEKWRKNEAAMTPFMANAQATADKLAALHAKGVHVHEAAQ